MSNWRRFWVVWAVSGDAFTRGGSPMVGATKLQGQGDGYLGKAVLDWIRSPANLQALQNANKLIDNADNDPI